MKLKKDDKVKVMAGKDKGKEGKIERVYAKAGTVLIGTINMYKKHIKKSEKMPQGGVVDVPRPIDVSKIMLICPKCGKTTKVGYEVKNGKKIRICNSCQNKI